MLYNLTYIRDNSVRRIIFYAEDMIQALEVESMLDRLTGAKLPNIEVIGASRFVNRAGRTELRKSA